jgi:hypothetical protein
MSERKMTAEELVNKIGNLWDDAKAKEADKLVREFITAYTAPLTAEVEKLRTRLPAAVRQAFDEGFFKAYPRPPEPRFLRASQDAAWAGSTAKAALDEKGKEGV